ncbi:MAG TPA: response regulator [Prolixibacteraceae bacterium]|nr:response regulator [Prolixibacteraceae bacterium]
MKFQKKILVIEDDLILGNVIKYVLTINHFDVCYVSNGASGIQKAFEYNPDLILCDIHMNPIDGYQVYRVLEESSILNRIPFVFLTGSSEIEEIRYGMSLGADDYLVKPFNNDDLIKSIEKRLEKFRIIREEASREFNQLFDFSTEGILIFDGNKVFKANKAFMKLLHIEAIDSMDIKLESFFELNSLHKLQLKIQEHLPDKTEIFNDEVILKNSNGEELQQKLFVSEFEKFSTYKLYIGLFTSLPKTNIPVVPKHYAEEVYDLLKHENIRISEALGEKITDIFMQKTLNLKSQHNSFFTKRENEVLCLSMEGLPIKNIADRLAISNRTVEKYRTRLMEKAGANNMIEVIVFALKNSLIEI